MNTKRLSSTTWQGRRRPYHVPPCQQFHSQWMESHCPECRDMRHEAIQEKILDEMRRANDLKEQELELGPKKPTKEPHYMTPTVYDTKPKIERRGA